jgi:hypothetical protein
MDIHWLFYSSTHYIDEISEEVISHFPIGAKNPETN